MNSRFERIETDWPKLLEDVSDTPYINKLASSDWEDTIRITTEFLPLHEVFPGRYTLRDQDIQEKFGQWRRERGRLPFPETTCYQAGSSSNNGTRWHSEYWIAISAKDLAAQLNLPYSLIRDESVVQPFIPTNPSSWRCWLGHHQFETEPGLLEYVKHTGWDILFSSSGIQKAEQRCLRCGHRRKVYREGMFGLGGPLSPSYKTKWKSLSPSTEKYIDSLRRM